MSRTLAILEVSQKQRYIFASKELRENAARSADIDYVTSCGFFKGVAGDLFDISDNLVYSGGGHTVLQFDSRNTARNFVQMVTEAVLRGFSGLELFAKLMDYKESMTPGENLKELSKALERKKARRAVSFRRLTFGVEALGMGFAPRSNHASARPDYAAAAKPPQGWEFPAQFENLATIRTKDGAEKKDNFIAVVHIDGNGMGKRVDEVYERNKESWDDCRKALREFSDGIQEDFESTFGTTVKEIIQRADLAPKELPIRPIILAGDDVCFVTAGSIGVECARIFLEKLAALPPRKGQKPYSACAGVAMVHLKYPFHMAYDLSEQLCSSAKKFGAKLDGEGRISAMDWHIEFGQLKDGLTDIRRDYVTEDGNRLELRPVAVVAPEEAVSPEAVRVRSYAFFSRMCRAMKSEYGKIARSKLKELRTALKQGELESQFFMRDKEISRLLYHGFDSGYADDERTRALGEKMKRNESIEKGVFRDFGGGDGVRRCLFFDAVELMDHCAFFGEVEA